MADIFPTAFNNLSEVSSELDRLDAMLSVMMKGFDEEQSKAQFKGLMAECDALMLHMAGLYRLESQLKRASAKVTA